MRLLLALLLCLAANFNPASAQGTVAPIALVGKWTTSSRHPSGATVVATVVIQQSMRFTGTVTLDGKPYWEYSGTWSVAGNTLTWRYEKSSRLQAPPGTVDTDEIVSVDDSTLILISKLSGRRREYVRTR